MLGLGKGLLRKDLGGHFEFLAFWSGETVEMKVELRGLKFCPFVALRLFLSYS